MVSDLILKINQQYSLESLYCIGNIENEEQLKELKENSFLVEYTKESWKKEFPSIPAENMYCVKCEAIPSGLQYMDMDHGILIDTHIYGKNGLMFSSKFGNAEEVMNHLIKEKMELYNSKEYLKLFVSGMSEQSGMLMIAMLSHLLEREEPCEKLYEAFLGVYTLVDYGCEKLSQKARQNLLKCKSEAQKEKTRAALADYGDEVRVYRGQGEASTPKEEALSWTMNKAIATFFATRFGHGNGIVLEGTVPKDRILEYKPEGLEDEVIVVEDVVTVTSVLTMMDMEEFSSYIWDIRDYIHGRKNEKSYEKRYNINSLMKRTLNLYEKYGDTKDHGKDHSCHVTMLANALYTMNAERQCGLSDEEIYRDYRRVMEAAVYHDIGRTHGFDDADHGKRSYQIYRKENGDNPVVKFLIENHCVEDEEASVNLEKSFPEDERERVFELLGILKDADALDRVRFYYNSKDYIKEDYLHDKEAVRLIGIATFMQSQTVDVWRSVD